MSPSPPEGTTPGPAPDADAGEAERVLGLLAEPDRFRVLAAVALGALDLGEVARRTELTVREAERAVARLTAGGLLVKDGAGWFRVAFEDLKTIARAAARRRGDDDDGPEGPGDSSDILRRFFRRGRLTSIPTTRWKRLLVLDFLAQDFTPGRRYPERQVNDMLRRYNDDVAALRRYLVDEGFMDRARGEYWRSGGTFLID